MIKLLKYMLLVIIIVSCQNNNINQPQKPDNLISKDKMVEILYDMSLLSAAKGVNKKTIENKGIYPDMYVYKKHGIDSLQFALSNEYYAYDLKQYEQLFAKVKVKLENDKDRINSEIELERGIKDSIIKSKRRASRDSLTKKRDVKSTKRAPTKMPDPSKKDD